MVAEKLTLNDWHIPFMLFELSSYVKNTQLRKQRQNSDELLSEMHNFFQDEEGEPAMDVFQDDLQIGGG